MPKKEGEPFLGTREQFADAYPQIKTIRIEYEQTKGESGILDETNITNTFPCDASSCEDGGFRIGDLLMHTTSTGNGEIDQTLNCTGHERGSKGKNMKPCLNRLKVNVRITYQNVPPKPTNDDDSHVPDVFKTPK